VKCSNCGADVPFSGKVCPLCRANKSKDQLQQILGVAGSVIGGWLGFSHGGLIWMIVLGVAGVVAGMGFGWIVYRDHEKRKRR